MSNLANSITLVRAATGGVQSITNGSEQQFVFDTVFDVSGDAFQMSNGGVRILRDGLYDINMQVSYYNVTIGRTDCIWYYLKAGGALTYVTRKMTGGTGFNFPSISMGMRLGLGDVIQMYTFQNQGGSQNTYGSDFLNVIERK